MQAKGDVFVKLVDDSGARFAEVAIFENDTVSRLIKRAASELRWGVDAGHVELFLVQRVGEDEPTSVEEAAALTSPRLGATLSLTRAHIVDGVCLLAKVTMASMLGTKHKAGPGGNVCFFLRIGAGGWKGWERRGKLHLTEQLNRMAGNELGKRLCRLTLSH